MSTALYQLRLKNLNRTRAGFTLVEALVTTLVLSMIYGGCLMLLIAGSDSFQINSNQVELQQDLRRGLDWIKEDLYEGISASISGVPADGTWQNSITFRKSAGVSGGSLVWSSDTITYARDTVNNRLQRSTPSVTRNIANNITAFQVRRQAATPEIVEVSIEATQNTLRGIPLVLTTTFEAHLRN